jgi:hypothetical protein
MVGTFRPNVNFAISFRALSWCLTVFLSLYIACRSEEVVVMGLRPTGAARPPRLPNWA